MLLQSRFISNNLVLLTKEQFQELVVLARKLTNVDIVELENDLPIEGLMYLQEKDRTLDFLNEPDENIYSVNDLKIRY